MLKLIGYSAEVPADYTGEVLRSHLPSLSASPKWDSRQEWRVSGKLHRVGAPALIYSNGTTGWFFRGTLHRTDGAASTHEFQPKRYYLLNNVVHHKSQIFLITF